MKEAVYKEEPIIPTANSTMGTSTDASRAGVVNSSGFQIKGFQNPNM